jgi:hypothetical protein
MSDNIDYSGRGHRLSHLEELRIAQMRKQNELASHQLKQQVEKQAIFEDLAQKMNQLLEDHKNGKIKPSSSSEPQSEKR